MAADGSAAQLVEKPDIPPRPKPVEEPQTNGQTNGDTNGHTNGVLESPAASLKRKRSLEMDVDEATVKKAKAMSNGDDMVILDDNNDGAIVIDD